MMYKITKKQLETIRRIIKNLLTFTQKGYGRINDISVMVNSQMPKNVFVKYEKEFNSSGEMDYEFVIMQIGVDGSTESIGSNFKTMYDRYNFISECKTFDIEDSSQYQVV